MGSRGPRPTPTAILEARGSWLAKAREKNGEPQPPRHLGRPEPPENCTLVVREHWEKIAPIYESMGVLTKADESMFWSLCECWCLYKQAHEEFLRTGGHVNHYNKETKTWSENPTLGALMKLQARWMKVALEFGMSPASRAGMMLNAASATAIATETAEVLDKRSFLAQK